MRPVGPTCPVCGAFVSEDTDAAMVFNEGEDVVCDHCESRLVCGGWSLHLDYEEDHHRLTKEVTHLRQRLAEVRASRAELRAHCELFGGRIESYVTIVESLRAELSGGQWTMRKVLALLEDGNVAHARTTLAHALRLDVGPVYGGDDADPLAPRSPVG